MMQSWGHWSVRAVAGVLMVSMMTGCIASRAPASAGKPPLPGYRDLQITTISRADEEDPNRIVAHTSLQNRGALNLHIVASLNAHAAAGLTGSQVTMDLAPDASGEWIWSFRPPAGLVREILSGRIDVNGRPDRDLWIAVQGPDPLDYDATGAERIDERGRVVASYAPRSHEAIMAAKADAAATRPPPEFVIAGRGRSNHRIVVTDLPAPPTEQDPLTWWRQAGRLTPAERDLVDAVEDLQRVIHLQGDAVLAIVGESAADRPAIRISLSPAFVPPDGLYDAYRLHTDAPNVFIDSDTLDGLRQGIYGLLTDYLDCRWFQPRQLGEDIPIPRDRTVRLPRIDEVRGARWMSANGASWGNAPRWDRRNRALVNRARMTFGHAWDRYINEREFPADRYTEYYARDRQNTIRRREGSRIPPNFCSTHSEVIEIVARKVNAAFDADPSRLIMSLDPNDYAPMCLCERCLALDRSYGQTAGDGQEVADRLLHFSREIHTRLKPEHRDRYLGILIYGFQMALPVSTHAHDRHAAIICNFPRRYDHSRPWNDPSSAQNREFYELLKGWMATVPHLGYYDYYGHWFHFGPYAVIHKMREDLPAFHDLGGTSLMLEAQPNFAAQGLNHYVAARLTWDIEADVDLALADFFNRYYGPAADAMRAYWLTAERWFALERPGTYTESRVSMRADYWNELERHLAAAERRIARRSHTPQSFADRVQLVRLGHNYGRLRFGYEVAFGQLAVRFLRQPVDHAAAIDYLNDHREAIDRLQDHHRADDPYWPALIPEYFRMDIDRLIERHTVAGKIE